MNSHDSDAQPAPTVRAELLALLQRPQTFDLAIIGGGATGLGVALDAAARGLSVALVESHDFAKGTSSRATKLVHGGVRYLAQGDISMVREALRERSYLLANAPHLAQPLPFVMPSYKLWEAPFYGAGLKIYDALAGRAGLGQTEFLSPQQTRLLLPTVRTIGPNGKLWGGVKYWDGQFDDARFAIALARTAARHGANLLNYCVATGLIHHDGRVAGLYLQDQETGRSFMLKANCVVNAAGVWVDKLRLLDEKALGRAAEPLVAPSQGVHIVVDRSFLPTDHAMLVPKTADGRVLFAVPWLGKTILGTTDTPREDLAREPLAFDEEIDFILRESAGYLSRAPARSDIRSMWVGLRPLVKAGREDTEETRSLSREHTVRISKSGFVTVTGGKWTTYRAMAEDVIEQCVGAGLLRPRGGLGTATLKLVGAQAASHNISDPPGLHLYGSEADFVQSLPGSSNQLGGGLTEAMVRFAARYEYARSVEDILARRSRLLFLDAAHASSVAPHVAALLRDEKVAEAQLGDFQQLCRQYSSPPEVL